MLRLAAVLLQVFGGLYLALVLVLIVAALTAFERAWPFLFFFAGACVPFGCFLLWLSIKVRRGQHLVLGAGVTGFFGVSTVFAIGVILAGRLGFLPALITALMGIWLSAIAVLLGLQHSRSAHSPPTPPGGATEK
jgi:hypothetical protein